MNTYKVSIVRVRSQCKSFTVEARDEEDTVGAAISLASKENTNAPGWDDPIKLIYYEVQSSYSSSTS